MFYIEYSLPEKENIEIILFNIKGQSVETVWRGNIERGNNEISFDTRRLSNGIYFLKVKTNNCVITKKIIIIK
ncbi:MAG TPA: T9SS type A sorting domain-containing protein [Candidatus Cloacimonetes bacterium]|nr:T9SS type A sorting domain-containing protein [Candidatus Cloacimonadota bacterium]